MESSGQDPNQQPICDGSPQPPQPPALRLELLVTPSGGDEEGTSHYERSHILTVRENQEVARMVEAEDGAGEALPDLGENVAWAADGKTILATTPGRLCVHCGRIWVDKALEICGDVDFSTGNLQFAEDIIVRGGVLDLFKVSSEAGTVNIGRAIEAAEVRAGKDLVVRGGIIGKYKGRCTVGRNLRARFITNATVEVAGDITVDSGISGARIVCGGRLQIRRGALVAGHTLATGGVTCQTLGSAGAVQTIVEAGIDEALRITVAERLTRLQEKQAKAARIRELVEPLMRNEKLLSRPQKEKATELLYEASETDERAKAELDALRSQYEQMQSRSRQEIFIASQLHPGVTIRFPGLEANVIAPLRGPLRIVPTVVQGRKLIAGVTEVSGRIAPLETHYHPDDALEVLQQLIGKAA